MSWPFRIIFSERDTKYFTNTNVYRLFGHNSEERSSFLYRLVDFISLFSSEIWRLSGKGPGAYLKKTNKKGYYIYLVSSDIFYSSCM